MQYLPPKTECTIFCVLTDMQRNLYELLLAALKEDVLLKNAQEGDSKKTKKGEESKRGKSPALSLLTTLKKLCNSPDLLIEMTVRKPDSLPDSVITELKPYKSKKSSEVVCHADFSSKVAFTRTLLLKIFKESDDRVVIVSMYKQTLEVLASLCKQNNIKYLQLDGETSIKKRQTLVDRLNDPRGEETVMLLSSKAGGVGLNLIGANHLILFDGSWNPADDAQAMARVWRPGQKKECFIYRLLCTGTVEEKIYQRQLTKTALSARVVEQKKGTDGSNFSTSDLRDLFKLRTETICETHDLLGCRCARREKTFGNSKVTVDELLQWEHVSDIENYSNSNIAKAGGGRASFMFLKRTDTKTNACEDEKLEVEKDEVLFDDLRGVDMEEKEGEEAYEDENFEYEEE
uniref:Helicase C-terminal domain-containing protein n=1 Tax=Paramoeba aestuarina TaxID=180227 RepID=A0A7S4UQR3_9EUKA